MKSNHEQSCPRLDVVHPGRAWPSSPSCTWHCSLHHRRRLHLGNRELRPGIHARTGANVAFCPGTFHDCALIFKVNVAALLAKFD